MRWLDDSKATNPHAAAASLAAHDRVVWLAGGMLKGALVDDLVLAHRGRLAGVVVLGVDRGGDPRRARPTRPRGAGRRRRRG